ncbi:hypothetical protein [Burkholderia cepacia]|uniref:hypothetical protein n=1 Tax=Burkholderia cepacia TaxID=292 RepID=UPI000B129AAB|nr:hypothetical protein [Burkholderia cepacia]
MSAELSGMVYDAPMTGNQSFIDKNAMNNCDERTLKYWQDLPLTLRREASAAANAWPESRNTDILFLFIQSANQA